MRPLGFLRQIVEQQGKKPFLVYADDVYVGDLYHCHIDIELFNPTITKSIQIGSPSITARFLIANLQNRDYEDATLNSIITITPYTHIKFIPFKIELFPLRLKLRVPGLEICCTTNFS